MGCGLLFGLSQRGFLLTVRAALSWKRREGQMSFRSIDARTFFDVLFRDVKSYGNVLLLVEQFCR